MLPMWLTWLVGHPAHTRHPRAAGPAGSTATNAPSSSPARSSSSSSSSRPTSSPSSSTSRVPGRTGLSRHRACSASRSPPPWQWLTFWTALFTGGGRRRMFRARKQVSAVIAARYALPADALQRLLEDDDYLSVNLQRFLGEASRCRSPSPRCTPVLEKPSTPLSKWALCRSMCIGFLPRRYGAIRPCRWPATASAPRKVSPSPIKPSSVRISTHRIFGNSRTWMVSIEVIFMKRPCRCGSVRPYCPLLSPVAQ